MKEENSGQKTAQPSVKPSVRPKQEMERCLDTYFHLPWSQNFALASSVSVCHVKRVERDSEICQALCV